MRRTIRCLVAGLLSIAYISLPAVAGTDCPSWEELLEEESIGMLEIANHGEVALLLAFIYVNLPELGPCALGDQTYQGLIGSGLLDDGVEVNLFWVGVGGMNAHRFVAEPITLVQGQNIGIVRNSAKLEPGTPLEDAPGVLSQYLLVFDGALDFSEPITILFDSGRATYSGEYWLDEKYLAGQ